jgi:hypothetical protein
MKLQSHRLKFSISLGLGNSKLETKQEEEKKSNAYEISCRDIIVRVLHMGLTIVKQICRLFLAILSLFFLARFLPLRMSFSFVY